MFCTGFLLDWSTTPLVRWISAQKKLSTGFLPSFRKPVEMGTRDGLKKKHERKSGKQEEKQRWKECDWRRLGPMAMIFTLGPSMKKDRPLYGYSEKGAGTSVSPAPSRVERGQEKSENSLMASTFVDFVILWAVTGLEATRLVASCFLLSDGWPLLKGHQQLAN